MTTSYDLPMPGDKFAGTVIASCWEADDPDELVLAGLLVLNDAPPFYTVMQIAMRGGRWNIETREHHRNIVDATHAYAEEVGLDA